MYVQYSPSRWNFEGLRFGIVYKEASATSKTDHAVYGTVCEV